MKSEMTEYEKSKVKKPVRNPNKRPCVARNITFSVQRENENLLKILNKKIM
jgi:hypothetical protein